ncbi:MAG: hypothetical protein IT266_00160 [Saprospiraceae bacterium]|nr:hypothetical protein [Saprospiraceae bacterium]
MYAALRKMENRHIVLWLIKDACWNLEWPGLAFTAYWPTLLLAAYITNRSLHEPVERWFNGAVCYWLLANGAWMFADLFAWEVLNLPARIFFAAGLAILFYYYLIIRPKLPADMSRA